MHTRWSLLDQDKLTLSTGYDRQSMFWSLSLTKTKNNQIIIELVTNKTRNPEPHLESQLTHLYKKLNQLGLTDDPIKTGIGNPHGKNWIMTTSSIDSCAKLIAHIHGHEPFAEYQLDAISKAMMFAYHEHKNFLNNIQAENALHLHQTSHEVAVHIISDPLPEKQKDKKSNSSAFFSCLSRQSKTSKTHQPDEYKKSYDKS